MADQFRDGDFGKAQVVGAARETVAEDMRRDIAECAAFENAVPLIGECTIIFSTPFTGEHISSLCFLIACFEKLDHGRANGSDLSAFVAAGQPQATAFEIDIGPFEANDFAATATSQRNQAHDYCNGSEFVEASRVDQ